MPSDLQIQGGQQFKLLARQLGQLDKDMAKELRTSVRDALTPIADAVRAEAAKHSQTVAKTITVQVQPTAKGGAKAAITARRSKMPPGHGDLPALLEGLKGPKFRHPVWGNREVWVEQDAHPFLAKTVLPRLDKAVSQIANALAAVAAKAMSVVGTGSNAANTRFGG